MNFMEDLIKEMNKVELYDVHKDDRTIKTIECSLVCDIISILFDKYGLEGAINDDLHG